MNSAEVGNLQQNIIDTATNDWKHWPSHACLQMDNILNTYC